MAHLEDVVSEVIDSAFLIHRELGPGLLESAYERILADELILKGFDVQRQARLALHFHGRDYRGGLTLDLLANPAAAQHR